MSRKSPCGLRTIALFGIASVVLCLLPVSVAADSRHSAKVHRIGVLSTRTPERLRESLREVGYIEGRNAVFETRETEGRAKG